MAENNKNANYDIHPYQTNNWVNASLEGNKYTFLLDSRYGTGAYQNGKYLIPHKRENQNDYDIRRSKSAYNNQYQAILNAHYKPIFKNEAKRVKKLIPRRVTLKAGQNRPNYAEMGIKQKGKTFVTGNVEHSGREHKDLKLNGSLIPWFK